MSDEPFETGAARPAQDGRDKSPRRGMCAAVLTLEAVVLGLSTPVMIAVSDVSAATALPVGLGLAVACVLVAGMLRKEYAYSLGWTIQGAALVLGFLVTTMFFLGGLFAVLWASADLLGRKIERERAAAFAAYDARQGGSEPA
ncbi:DUF4233 domain-containing protein [soil metagenome]